MQTANLIGDHHDYGFFLSTIDRLLAVDPLVSLEPLRSMILSICLILSINNPRLTLYRIIVTTFDPNTILRVLRMLLPTKVRLPSHRLTNLFLSRCRLPVPFVSSSYCLLMVRRQITFSKLRNKLRECIHAGIYSIVITCFGE